MSIFVFHSHPPPTHFKEYKSTQAFKPSCLGLLQITLAYESGREIVAPEKVMWNFLFFLKVRIHINGEKKKDIINKCFLIIVHILYANFTPF